MKALYQKTFDTVRLSDMRADAIRAQLAAAGKTEVIPMKKHVSLRRPLVLAAILVLAFALSITAFAYGMRRFDLMTGGVIREGVDEEGNSYVEGTLGTEIEPIAYRDGRVWLTVNGENRDITEEFSYTEPYIYECTGSDGLRHAFIIGGETDAVGWVEFLWDETGFPRGGGGHFGTPEGSADAPWLQVGKDILDLPW